VLWPLRDLPLLLMVEMSVLILVGNTAWMGFSFLFLDDSKRVGEILLLAKEGRCGTSAAVLSSR